MTDLQLYSQISSLPADLKKEVSDFVELLEGCLADRAAILALAS